MLYFKRSRQEPIINISKFESTLRDLLPNVDFFTLWNDECVRVVFEIPIEHRKRLKRESIMVGNTNTFGAVEEYQAETIMRAYKAFLANTSSHL